MLSISGFVMKDKKDLGKHFLYSYRFAEIDLTIL